MKKIEEYLKQLQEAEAGSDMVVTSISSGHVDPGMETVKSYGYDDTAYVVDEDKQEKVKKKKKRKE
jgi:hypothetical protein